MAVDAAARRAWHWAKQGLDGSLAGKAPVEALTEFGGLSDLPSHAIVDRGRVVGLWEYDPEASSIAWLSFVPRDRALVDAVSRTESFVRARRCALIQPRQPQEPRAADRRAPRRTVSAARLPAAARRLS